MDIRGLIERGAPVVTPLRAERIEPGLLSVFRFFTGLHLAIAAALMASGWLFGFGPPWQAWDLLTLVWLAILLVYLSMPRLEARLGRAYLPLALAFAAAMPLVVWALDMNPERLSQVGIGAMSLAIGSSWRLFVALLIPLLLISWQYSFGVVLAYVAATTLIDVGMLSLLLAEQPVMLEVAGITFSRMIVFLFTGYVVTRLMAAQRCQREALAEANLQLAHYASTVEQLAVSHERNRLARELHDTLAHTLSALSVQLEAVDSAWETAPDRARTLLIKALAGTRSGLTETRRALQSLRAAPLEDLGLALAVRTLAETSAARGGLALDVDIPEELGLLSPEEEQAMYRIAQEALANALRHAHAQRLRVALTPVNGHVRLEVADDGQGFDLDQVPGTDHFGLQGMRERAALVGGRLAVVSRPGAGTQVQFETR